jgi:hypothetical protein
LLLVGCGFIEGYLSPDPDFPMINRVIVGFGYAIVMIAALTGRLFGRSPPRPGSHVMTDPHDADQTRRR